MPSQIRKFARSVRLGSLLLVVFASVASVASAQTGQTITGTATLKTAGGVAATAPVTITITRFATDAERNDLMSAIKAGGTTAARDHLAKREAVGTLQIGARKTPIKYAYSREMGADHLITVVTAEPIAFLGAGAPEAKPKAGYDLGLVLLQLPASGQGTGELAPAAKIKLDDKGAIVTEDYGAEAVRLSNVAKK